MTGTPVDLMNAPPFFVLLAADLFNRHHNTTGLIRPSLCSHGNPGKDSFPIVICCYCCSP